MLGIWRGALLAGMVVSTVCLAQPPPPVRTLEVSEHACSRDGWCVEYPWPLWISAVHGDARRTVVGSQNGVLVMHERGAWRSGVDTGLGDVNLLEVKADRVLACDARRCLEVSLGEDGFGPLLPGAPPRPRKPRVLEGVFGEGGRYTLQNGRLEAFVQGQRVLSQRATDALGAAGSPLWFLERSHVSRYVPGAKGPEKVVLGCSPWCWGGPGSLFGDAHAPTLRAPLLLQEGVYAFDGERFSPLFALGIPIKSPQEVLLGGGCAPCVLGFSELAVRRPGHWDYIRLPEIKAHERPASLAPSETWGAPSPEPYAVGLGEGGWPTLVFEFPDEKVTLPRQTWTFDGTGWRKGAGARTERVLRRGYLTGQTPAGWEILSGSSHGCAVRTPWGERWTFSETALTVQGAGGRRVERLPMRLWNCDVFSGEHGVFVFREGAMLSKRWERLSWGTGSERGTYRVVGVEPGDVLQVRRGPDPVAGILTGLAPGACVEGTGARTQGRGGVWLKVRGGEAAEGWVNARSLRAGTCTP